jgi:hypothetical protein
MKRDHSRHIDNATKLGAMVLAAVLIVVGAVVLVGVLVWPMLLWYTFDQSLAVAVAITVTWVAAIL